MQMQFNAGFITHVFSSHRVGRERSTSTVTQEEEYCARYILIKTTSSQGKLFLLMKLPS